MASLLDRAQSLIGKITDREFLVELGEALDKSPIQLHYPADSSPVLKVAGEEILQSLQSDPISMLNIQQRMASAGVNQEIIDSIGGNAEDLLPFLTAHEVGHVQDIDVRGRSTIAEEARAYHEQNRALMASDADPFEKIMKGMELHDTMPAEISSDKFAADFVNKNYRDIWPEKEWAPKAPDIPPTPEVLESAKVTAPSQVAPEIIESVPKPKVLPKNPKIKLGSKEFQLKMPKAGTVIGAGMALMDFRRRYQEGESIPTAAFKTAAVSAMYAAVPWLGWASAAYGITKTAGRVFDTARDSLMSAPVSNLTSFGQNYTDTQAAATMRQAAQQVIQQSQLNARYLMGNEAKYMRRG